MSFKNRENVKKNGGVAISVYLYGSFAVADPDLRSRGGGGAHADPEIREEAHNELEKFRNPSNGTPKYTDVSIVTLSSIPPNLIKKNRNVFLIFPQLPLL